MKKKITVLLISAILPLSVLADTGITNDKTQTQVNELSEDAKASSLKNTNVITEDIPLVEGPSPHLTFHMGLSAEGQNFVGGSIENRGKVSVHGGYLVILPLDEKCNPLTPIMHEFGKISSGEVLPFRAPISQPLSAYRVIGFNAFDDMGFQIESVDDTLEIIAKRIPDERKACENKRTQVSTQQAKPQ